LPFLLYFTNNKNKIKIDIKINEEEIQQYSKDNFGRELTGIELNRIRQSVWDMARFHLMYDAIEEAMDNKNDGWFEIDQDYLVNYRKNENKNKNKKT
jgi:hypothetical protein